MQKKYIKIDYSTIEAYPIEIKTASELNYNSFIQELDFKENFKKVHQVEWNKENLISANFMLKKINNKIEDVDITILNKVDIIFYDAFAPSAQANLWEEEVLTKMFDLLKPKGFLITYCAKGIFKRTLKKIGFNIEALPGPIGKREITHAWKA